MMMMGNWSRTCSCTVISLYLYLLIIFCGRTVNSVKIKSGKPTEATVPSTLTPKFVPSQQIVTDLLTPTFTSNAHIISPFVRKKSGKGSRNSLSSGSGSGFSTTAWSLEFPKVPVELEESGTRVEVSMTSSSSDQQNSHPLPEGAEWIAIRKDGEEEDHNMNILQQINYIRNQNSPKPSSTVLRAPSTLLPVTVHQGLVNRRIGSFTDDNNNNNEEQSLGPTDEEEDDRESNANLEKIQGKSKLSQGKGKRQKSVPQDLELRIQKLESLLTSMNKNVEVMRQNTQVISKGFNILSTRFNKLSSDQDELNLKLDKKFVLMEEGMIRMQKEVGKKIKELDSKNKDEIRNLKSTDQDLLESQVTNGQQHKKWMESVTEKVEGYKSVFENESKVLAEMVKALAEIQKKDKAKIDKLEKKVESYSQSQSANNRSITTLTSSLHTGRMKELESTLDDVRTSAKNESEVLKRELVDLSKYMDDKVKRLEESLQDQNMAHNMAHEHIARQIMKLEERNTVKNDGDKGYKADLLGLKPNLDTHQANAIHNMLMDKMNRLEANLTRMGITLKRTEGKLESMEDTDMSILSRVADLRNTQAFENNWTKSELFRLTKNLNETQEGCRIVEGKLREIADTKAKSRMKQDNGSTNGVFMNLLKKDEDNELSLMEVGGLSMASESTYQPQTEPSQSLRSTLDPITPTADNEIVDRLDAVEENMEELTKSQKECKSSSETLHSLLTQVKTEHETSLKSQALRISEIQRITKSLSDLLQNNTGKQRELEQRLEELQDSLKFDRKAEMESDEISARAKPNSKSPFPEDIAQLQKEVHKIKEVLEELQDTNKNVTKAQEFFMFKMLEMDQEHKSDNKSIGEELLHLRNQTEDTLLEIVRSEERLNKVVQQFEITDAEQAKIREELLNIKDRLAALEENYVNVWKNNKKVVTELEQVVNTVDNIHVVHGSELRTLSTELADSKDKLDNVTKSWRNVENRVANLEVIMEVDGGTGTGGADSELSKLKRRLGSAEKDISELWKSSEIISFQQQVVSENFRNLESVHHNDSSNALMERAKVQQDSSTLFHLYQNLTKRVASVEKCTNPPYESKTINFMIPDWHATLSSGLEDEFIEYEVGSLIGHQSTWKTYLQLNEDKTHFSVHNILLKSEMPMFNEFEIQLLDGDGRIFTSYGPEQNLYKGKGDRITFSNLIPLHLIESSKNGLVHRNTLRLRLKVRVYPKWEKENDSEQERLSLPSEKQLIIWEVTNLKEALSQNINKLKETKEFAAGFTWNGFSLWRLSLLVKSISRQDYLGINVEMIQNDGEWKELHASYNVTILDAHDRLVKEFAISSNDFQTVAARHSYFMLIKDVQEILKRGDLVTFKINFDLQAKRKSYEVEVIK